MITLFSYVAPLYRRILLKIRKIAHYVVPALLLLVFSPVVVCVGTACFIGSRHLLRRRSPSDCLEIIRAGDNYTPLRASGCGCGGSLTKILLVAEDRNFYSHHGYEVESIISAFWHLVKLPFRVLILHRTDISPKGGSTLTQQLVKNLYFTYKRCPLRKLTELFIALTFEKELTKDEILWMYVNFVYFGNEQYGVGNAARHYFGIPANELTFSEALFLVSTLAAPTTHNPRRSREAAAGHSRKMLNLLTKCAAAGIVTGKEAEKIRRRIKSGQTEERLTSRTPTEYGLTIPKYHPLSLSAKKERN
ncbi:MAG: transglycosylase domain-containing protein [Clostridiales bacterium]|nr:transglycosylase domain-containing protein [Clostridiales bacterium]